MELLAYALIVLILLAVFAAVVLKVGQGSTSDDFVKKTVITHTKDDQSIRGVLLHDHVDRYTLTQAVYLAKNGSEAPIDGLTHIPKVNIAWVQEVEA